MGSRLFFDVTSKVSLGWLAAGVWEPSSVMMQDICAQLRAVGVTADPETLSTNSAIKEVESWIVSNRGHKFFGDQRSLAAEYRRVWNLARLALVETPSAASDYAKTIQHDKKTDAADRLREKLAFQNIVLALQEGRHVHPKLLALKEIVRAEVSRGRKTMILCLTHAGAEEISSFLEPLVGKVYRLHGGVKPVSLYQQDFVGFNQTRTGVAVATASLERKIGLVVDTIVHYHLISANLSYLNEVMPLPRIHQVLIAVNHPWDIGMGFCSATPPLRPRAMPRRGKRTEGVPTPLLPFERPT